MQKSFVKLGTRLRGQERPSTYKRNWSTASRNSHELLDKLPSRRQYEHFKSVRNARRPFYHYFRQMYTCSPYVGKPIVSKRGQISSYQAMKMATNPNASWRTPWDSIGKSGYSSQEHEHRRSGKIRLDVIEPLPIEFGEDEADRSIAKLLNLRFEWDKEDELFVQRVVPSSMYTLCSHSARFATEQKKDNSFNDRNRINESNEIENDDDSEVLYISGVKVNVRSPLPTSTSSSSCSSSSFSTSLRRFSGVDVIPSFLLDLTRGPFLSHPQEPLLTLRWKAENRNASSVLQVIQERRKLHVISLVALPPRSLLYLTKVVACDEMEEPALDIALAVAIAENYNSYSEWECVELLRCLRRVAFVQRLPELYLHEEQQFTKKNVNNEFSNENIKQEIPLYQNARLMQSVLARYAWDASPLLIERVWCRLPEILQHLQRNHRYLDWIDVMLLSIELHGMHHLPSNLPNASSHVTEACKYLFLRYTIHMDKSFMHSLVHSFGKQHTLKLLTTNLSPCDKRKQKEEWTLPIRTLADGHWHNASFAERTNGLILWTVASTLIRLVAESVGELLQYVLRVLHSYIMMMEITPTKEVKETLSCEFTQDNRRELLTSSYLSKDEIASRRNTSECTSESSSNTQSNPHFSEETEISSNTVPFPLFQHYTLHPYDAKLKTNHVRWRFMPFEAFPTIHSILYPPCWSITRRVITKLDKHDEANDKEIEITKYMENAVCDLVVSNVNNTTNCDELQHEEEEHKHTEVDSNSLTDHQNKSPSSEKNNEKCLNSESTYWIRQSSELLRHVQRACECLSWGTHVLRCSRALIYNLPLHDGLDRADKLEEIGSNDNNSNNKHNLFECNKVERQRSELCYAFARSKIQLHMDALFDFIAWKEIDSLLYDMINKLTVQNKHISFSDVPHKREHYDGNKQREFGSATPYHSTSSKTNENEDRELKNNLTEMEQMTDVQLVELLHEWVDKFEVAVADMLDEHERYFSELYEVDMTGDAGNEERQ